MAKLRQSFLPAFVFLFAIVLGWASPALAAVSAGTVRGVVTGPDGKPMDAVSLTLRNGTTGFTATATTGRDGFFNSSTCPSTRTSSTSRCRVSRRSTRRWTLAPPPRSRCRWSWRCRE